ncbi:MAG: 50S ribosomal protein L5 [Candidatus Saccharimonadales bacterium]|nr:50S ribosomal protein L5 [Candidatus Saccharimonadales bacterium]
MAKSTYTPRLKEQFEKDLRKKLIKQLNLKNVHQVPQLEKVVVSVGLGRGKDDKRLFEVAANTLAKITGQAPVEALAKKSIASFKLREGNRIGLKVTLRGDRMYEFVDRVINVVLPRLRDFHGVSIKSFDGQGNFNIGFKDQSVFPELSFEETTVSHGVQVTIVTTANDKESAHALLSDMGMPFEKIKESN